ncbi:MAG: hypothetical protein PHO62_06240 [Sulfurimonas sp.]|nr:hypothetical protein [Sulfurimonas sp.]MDD5373008.1 hypothetical protein [Sulfurimonas sp.]
MSKAHLATLAAVALKLAAKSGRKQLVDFTKREHKKGFWIFHK